MIHLSSIFLGALLGAISLGDISGERLAARAHFDVNNVCRGELMKLYIDFTGDADFENLHPPELSREVDPKVWRVDDESAKTDTDEYSRRLVYRVYPMKEGLVEFPSLEFEYGAQDSIRKVSTRSVPVHVKPGTQAALAGLDEADDELPMPDGLLFDVTSRTLDDDEAFAWRKACAQATSAAFAKFDFPEARLNEAAALVNEGYWAKALKIYYRLEWQIGQTSAIERGIVAALARKNGERMAELPAWRVALRPVLAYGWSGRAGIICGIIGAFALLCFIAAKAIRLFVTLAVVVSFTALPCSAQDIFEEMDRIHRQMMERMNSMMQATSPSGAMHMTINGEREDPVQISAAVAMSPEDVQVGETFKFIVDIESPKSVTLDQLRFTPSEMFGLVASGKAEELGRVECANPSNTIRRIAVPVRYDVPFKGDVSFRVDGMASRRRQTGNSSFSFSQSFSAVSPALQVEIKPLPADNQPADFSGAIGEGFKLSANANITRVETNDVVTITYTLSCKSGYIPSTTVSEFIIRRPGSISWQEYFIARGETKTPLRTIVCYDTSSRTYKRIGANRFSLEYVAPEQLADESVAVDSSELKGVRTVTLRFAPSENSPVVERIQRDASSAPMPRSGERGEWVRVDSGRHAGWVKKEELE